MLYVIYNIHTLINHLFECCVFYGPLLITDHQLMVIILSFMVLQFNYICVNI